VSIFDYFVDTMNPRFITATPQKVDFFEHDASKPEGNRKLFNEIKDQPIEKVLTKGSSELWLFDHSLFMVDPSDTEYPVQFLNIYQPIKHQNRTGILDNYIWKKPGFNMKIDGTPLSSYGLFKVLLPKFGLVMMGAEQTPDGERLAKRNLATALDLGLFVYILDKDNQLYDIDNYKQIENNEDLLWGVDNIYKRQRLLVSTKPIV